MESQGTWIVLIVIFVILPLFFWYRVSVINKRKDSVSVRCPFCETDQRLAHLRNYRCVNCGELIRFFDDEGTPLPSAETYNCEICGGQNFVGVLTCTACGNGNKAGIPNDLAT